MWLLKVHQFLKRKSLKAAIMGENVKLLQGLETGMSVLQAAESKHIKYRQGTRSGPNKDKAAEDTFSRDLASWKLHFIKPDYRDLGREQRETPICSNNFLKNPFCPFSRRGKTEETTAGRTLLHRACCPVWLCFTADFVPVFQDKFACVTLQ